MISILCVTKNEPHAEPFLTAMENDAKVIGAEFVRVVDGVDVHSNGCIESVLDQAVSMCHGDYVLRLDDDESLSGGLRRWLQVPSSLASGIYTFPRRNLWGNDTHYITNDLLCPDLQTRLTTKDKAGGRGMIHGGSPFGIGTIISLPILHHKYLVRSYEERKAIAETYESISPGAGFGFYKIYSLPEDCIAIRTEKV